MVEGRRKGEWGIDSNPERVQERERERAAILVVEGGERDDEWFPQIRMRISI